MGLSSRISLARKIEILFGNTAIARLVDADFSNIQTAPTPRTAESGPWVQEVARWT